MKKLGIAAAIFVVLTLVLLRWLGLGGRGNDWGAGVASPELLSEKTLTGSNMGSNQFRTDMPRYIEMYLDGRLLLDEMISKTIALEEINEGFDEMKAGNVARNVIVFD